MVWLWAIGTILSTIIAGTQLGSNEKDLFDDLMVVRIAQVGTWSVPVPNSDFFTTGISTLLNWDMSFLEGSYLLMFCYLLNIGLTFILLGIFVGVIYSVFT